MAKIQITEIETEVAPTQNAPLRDKIIYGLRNVYDLELPINVYDLGLVYEIDISSQNNVIITYTLTAPNCPVAEQIPSDMAKKIKEIPEVGDVKMKLTFSPPWQKSMMSEAAQLELGYL